MTKKKEADPVEVKEADPVEEPQTVPPGFVLLEGGNCSVEGVEYIAKDGILTVSIDHAKLLIHSHGHKHKGAK